MNQRAALVVTGEAQANAQAAPVMERGRKLRAVPAVSKTATESAPSMDDTMRTHIHDLFDQMCVDCGVTRE